MINKVSSSISVERFLQIFSLKDILLYIYQAHKFQTNENDYTFPVLFMLANE
jgi:hypothetical protein